MAFSPGNILTILKAVSAVTTLIGGSTSPRIYPLVLPATSTLPAITYNQVGRTVNRVANLSTDRWQLDCWGLTFASSYSLSQAVWNALQTYNGVISGVRIEDIRMINQVSTFESASGYYRHMLEFRTVTL
jgi:hypothetical protein